MKYLIQKYDLILKTFREMAISDNFYFKPIKPKLYDLELITLNIIAESSGPDSEYQLFRELKFSSLEGLIERSIYNKSRRKLFPFIEKLRKQLANKSIQTNKEKMKGQIDQIWQYAQSISETEDDLPEPPDLTTINKEKVEQAIAQLNKALVCKKDIVKKVKAKLNYINKNFPKNIQKYEQQEAILGERNSYSKTDEDATFMRMKEDHMKNGQLKPSCNTQISTSNQYIVNYTIHPNPTDTTTLSLHLAQHQQSYGAAPKALTADAGYGSEENYTLLEKLEVDAFVKYGKFDKEQSQRYKDKQPFTSDKLFYDEQNDHYICPMGQKMEYIGDSQRRTSTGFEQNHRKYQAKNCNNYPLNGGCHKAKGNRITEINVNLNRLKDKSHQLLYSELGIDQRKKRCYDVEPVFGNFKHNHGFKRFMLSGKEKVTIEWGLITIAHNIRKKAA